MGGSGLVHAHTATASDTTTHCVSGSDFDRSFVRSSLNNVTACTSNFTAGSSRLLSYQFSTCFTCVSGFS